jgi:hypothetical protein
MKNVRVLIILMFAVCLLSSFVEMCLADRNKPLFKNSGSEEYNDLLDDLLTDKEKEKIDTFHFPLTPDELKELNEIKLKAKLREYRLSAKDKAKIDTFHSPLTPDELKELTEMVDKYRKQGEKELREYIKNTKMLKG